MVHWKTGTEASGREMKKTLKASYAILHDSPARRDDYQSVTDLIKVPLAFCATRWIEDKPVADRFIVLWPNLIKVMEFWKKLRKHKQRKNKSYEYLKNVLQDPLLIEKLEFYSYFSKCLNPSWHCTRQISLCCPIYMTISSVCWRIFNPPLSNLPSLRNVPLPIK